MNIVLIVQNHSGLPNKDLRGEQGLLATLRCHRLICKFGLCLTHSWQGWYLLHLLFVEWTPTQFGGSAHIFVSGHVFDTA